MFRLYSCRQKFGLLAFILCSSLNMFQQNQGESEARERAVSWWGVSMPALEVMGGLLETLGLYIEDFVCTWCLVSSFGLLLGMWEPDSQNRICQVLFPVHSSG